jgi:uncharacterized membrane protein
MKKRFLFYSIALLVIIALGAVIMTSATETSPTKAPELTTQSEVVPEAETPKKNRDYAENKNFFDVLKERESEITVQFDIPLNWERKDETRYSAIRLIRDGDINADESELAAIKEWHIAYLLKLKAVFTPEIERARETLQSP